MQLDKNESALRLWDLLDQSLDDTASVRVSRQVVDLSTERVHDGLDILNWNTLNDPLNDVVAILILHSLEYIFLQLFDHFSLLVYKNMLERFLHDSAGVHLIGQSEDMALHLRSKDTLLDLVAVFEELLDDVVSKDVLHKL